MSNTELIAEAREYADAIQGGENENWMRLVTFVDEMADALEAAERYAAEIPSLIVAAQMIERDAIAASLQASYEGADKGKASTSNFWRAAEFVRSLPVESV